MVCVPMVGIVVTTSPNFSLYRMVVLPDASRPTISILSALFFRNLFANLDIATPMLGVCAEREQEQRKME